MASRRLLKRVISSSASNTKSSRSTTVTSNGQRFRIGVSSGRRLRTTALERFMPVTTPTRSPSRTNRALMSLSRMRCPASSIVEAPSMKNGGAIASVPHPRPQDGFEALRPLLPGERVELARDFGIEERREGRIAPDQSLNDRLGDQMTERLFGGNEVLAGGAMHDGARIEAVLGAKHGLERVAGPSLDGALDDNVEELRGASLLDDGFTMTEIADVERRLEFLDLLVGKAIEGRIENVKSVHQRR